MRHLTFNLILFSLAFVSTILLGQSDSLILYDPNTLIKTDFVVNYDTNNSIEETNSSIGDFGNKTDLDITLPDSVRNRFTYNNLASDAFDMSSFPIRANIALHPNRFYGDTDYYKAYGSGILVSPNAVLTAGHVIGYEANNIDLGIYFKWKDSIYVSPSLQDGYPQAEIGNIKVKKCYVFKRFVNSLGHLPYDDLSLLILEEPIGYEIGWMGLGYVSSDSFLLNNIFYNFSYPGMDGYDGLNMYYKYGQFSSVSYNLATASDGITGIPGESGSGFFFTDNSKYTVYGIRTYSSFYTLITEQKLRIFKNLIEENFVSHIDEISEKLKHVVIYPNPAQNYIQIKIEDLSYDMLIITIWNIQGQILQFIKKYSIGDVLDISNLQKGLYLIEIKTDKRKITKKLIIY